MACFPLQTQKERFGILKHSFGFYNCLKSLLYMGIFCSLKPDQRKEWILFFLYCYKPSLGKELSVYHYHWLL